MLVIVEAPTVHTLVSGSRMCSPSLGSGELSAATCGPGALGLYDGQLWNKIDVNSDDVMNLEVHAAYQHFFPLLPPCEPQISKSPVKDRLPNRWLLPPDCNAHPSAAPSPLPSQGCLDPLAHHLEVAPCSFPSLGRRARP